MQKLENEKPDTTEFISPKDNRPDESIEMQSFELQKNDFRTKMQFMSDRLKESNQLNYIAKGDDCQSPQSYHKIMEHNPNINKEFANQIQQSDNIQDQINSFENKPLTSQYNYSDFLAARKQNSCKLDYSNISEERPFNFNKSNMIPDSEISAAVKSLSQERSLQNQTDKFIDEQNTQIVKKDTTTNQQMGTNTNLQHQQTRRNSHQGLQSHRCGYAKKFCLKILYFLKLKKELTNFDRGIQIINNALQNQANKATRIKQKVMMFIQTLHQQQKSRQLKIFNEKQFYLINDASYFHNHLKTNEKQNNQQHSIFRKYNQLIETIIQKLFQLIDDNIIIPLFMPTDLFILIWDIINILFISCFSVTYSVQVFFAQDQFSSQYMVIIFYIIIGISVMDILFKLNTCYFEKDQIISKRSKIALKYFTSNVFATDIISLMSIFLKLHYKHGEISYNPDHDIFVYIQNCLIFLILNRLGEKKNRFHNVITLEEYQKHVFRLFTQLLNVMSVTHLASISWYMLGIYEESKQYQVTWLSKSGIGDLTYYEKYIYSIYWTTTTMTTVGYGDISATNSTEALFITFIMILFSTVFAYSINNIGFILQEIEKSSKKLNDNLTIIQRQCYFKKSRIKNNVKKQLKIKTRYLQRKNVNISLKGRVRHYLNFLASESKNRDKEAEDEIIGVLSNKLRNEITEEINTKILNQYHLFSSNFSSKMMKDIAYIMEEVLVAPNEIIFQEGDVNEQSIYFIVNGIIEIFSSRLTHSDGSCVVLQELSTNQLFGEISFFSGLSRMASARSVNLTTLYRIQRQKFIVLLQTNDEDFERLKMMQEQIIFSQNLKCLFIQCYSCKQLGHLASQCPKTHTPFDKQAIILKNIFSIQQKREPLFNRKKTKCIQNPRMLIKKNKSICKKIKQDLKEIIDAGQYGQYNSQQDDQMSQSNELQHLISESSSSESQSSSHWDKTTNSKSIKQSLRVHNSEREISQKRLNQQNNGHQPSFTQEQGLVNSKQHLGNINQEQKSNKQSFSGSFKCIPQIPHTDYLNNYNSPIYDESQQQKGEKLTPSFPENSQNPLPSQFKQSYFQNENQQGQEIKEEDMKLSQLQYLYQHSSPQIDSPKQQLQQLQQLQFQFYMQSQQQQEKFQNEQIRSEENIAPSLQKAFMFDTNNKSLQNIDGASELIAIGSKKNIEHYVINNVAIQGASTKDQQNYFSMKLGNNANSQIKKLRGSFQDDEQPKPSFQNLNNDYSSLQQYQQSLQKNQISQVSFNNPSEKPERFDSFEDINSYNKSQQNTGKNRISGIEQSEKQIIKSLLKLNKQHKTNQANQMMKQKSYVKQQTANSNLINNDVNSTLNNDAVSKFQQQSVNSNVQNIQDILYKFHQKYLQNHKEIQQKPDSLDQIMDYFDSLKIFKTFFPQNNFTSVISSLKKQILEKRKLKQRNQKKKKRTNIIFTGFKPRDVYQEIKSKIEMEEIQSYQPSYLSYGVYVKKEQNTPPINLN